MESTIFSKFEEKESLLLVVQLNLESALSIIRTAKKHTLPILLHIRLAWRKLRGGRDTLLTMIQEEHHQQGYISCFTFDVEDEHSFHL